MSILEAIDVIRDFYDEIDLCKCGDISNELNLYKSLLNVIHKQETSDDINFCLLEQKKVLGLDCNSSMSDAFLNIIKKELDRCGYLEHGCSIHGAWTSNSGKNLLNALNLFDDLSNII